MSWCLCQHLAHCTQAHAGRAPQLPREARRQPPGHLRQPPQGSLPSCPQAGPADKGFPGMRCSVQHPPSDKGDLGVTGSQAGGGLWRGHSHSGHREGSLSKAGLHRVAMATGEPTHGRLLTHPGAEHGTHSLLRALATPAASRTGLRRKDTRVPGPRLRSEDTPMAPQASTPVRTGREARQRTWTSGALGTGRQP